MNSIGGAAVLIVHWAALKHGAGLCELINNPGKRQSPDTGMDGQSNAIPGSDQIGPSSPNLGTLDLHMDLYSIFLFI